MVNMYGAGQAFNLRYLRNSQLPRSAMYRPAAGLRQPIDMHHCCHQQTNVEVQVGPKGFWGFMSGLFGGMGGFGGIASMIGMFNKAPTSSAFGTQGQGQAQPKEMSEDDKNLAKLKQLYSQYVIVPEEDGKFTASKDGKIIAKKLTYDEMLNLGEALQAEEDAKKKAEAEKLKQQQEQTPDNNQDGATPPTKTTPTPQSVPGKGNGKGKITVSKNWYRATVSGEYNKLNLDKSKSAREVVNKLLTSKVDYLSADDRALLTKEMIRNNPSVFKSNGDVKPGAKWDRLDIPSIQAIKDTYVDNYQKSDTKSDGRVVTYTSKKGDKKTNINKSAMGKDGKSVVKPNGYRVNTTASGHNIYYDNKGNPITQSEFEKACS